MYLNIYDMSLLHNRILSPLGLGLYHSGIQVFGMEVTYGTTGVFSNKPRKAHGAVFRKSVFLGRTSMTLQELKHKVHDLVEHGFGPTDYDILIR